MPRVERQGRLQRPADFTGARLETFAQVWWRHGLPGAALAVLLLCLPQMHPLLAGSGARLLPLWPIYAISAVCIATLLGLYATLIQRRPARSSLLWIGYLLCLSIWEEWAFRLALPSLGVAIGLQYWAAVVASNVAFGAVHFFTLRWRWQWCVGAAIGGLLLSRHFHTHQEFMTIATLHWVGTFLNTPSPPGAGRVCR